MIACIVHVFAVGATLTFRGVSRVPSVSSEAVASAEKPRDAAPSEIAVDFTDAPEIVQARVRADLPAASRASSADVTAGRADGVNGAGAARGVRASSVVAREHAQVAGAGEASERGLSPGASVVAGAGESWSFDATRAEAANDVSPRRDILATTARGLAGLNVADAREGLERPAREAAEEPSGPRASRTGGLVEALDAADHAKGLGHGGPVLAAVEDAARIPGETPPEGSAVYEVVVRRGGGVSVSLASASEAYGSWAALTSRIERDVSARNVAMPESAAGLRFVVHVDARVQYPDGKRPATMGTKVVATTGEVGKSEDHPGLSFPRVPMVGVYHSGKVCSAGVAVYPGMVAFGGACSPENIGQPASRIVHGRIESESRL